MQHLLSASLPTHRCLLRSLPRADLEKLSVEQVGSPSPERRGLEEGLPRGCGEMASDS